MEHSGTTGDGDNSSSGKTRSDSLTMEEQISSSRVGEVSLPRSTEGVNVVDTDQVKVKGPASVVPVAAEVEDESLEVVEENTPTIEKNAGEASKCKSANVQNVIIEEKTVEPCEQETERPIAPIEKQSDKEGKNGKALDDNLHCGDVTGNKSPDVVMNEVSHDSDENMVCESNDTITITDSSETANDNTAQNDTTASNNELLKENIVHDDAAASSSETYEENNPKDTSIASDATGSHKASGSSKSTEKNCEGFNDNEIEVIADGTVVGQISKEVETRDVLDEVIPRKRARGGRPRKSSRHPESIIENGTPEAEVHVEEVSPGRPRRKAAQKAGDQIKQIVGSEEEISEIIETLKETEWTAEPKTEIPPRKICYQCCRLRPCQYHLLVNGVSRYMCTTPCFQSFRKRHPPKPNQAENDTASGGGEVTTPAVDVSAVGDAGTTVDPKPVQRKEHTLECAFCHRAVPPPTSSDKSLSWETMEFCNEGCLGKYQDQLSSSCSQCRLPVQRISMGKYCVRFGYNIKQFCCSTCLEEFKKGLKTCTYCQKDISTGAEGFLAPVGDKGQFKDFCSPTCMEQYDHISSGTRPQTKEAACAVCDKVRPVISEVVTRRLGKNIDNSEIDPPVYSLCSHPCFAAFKFVNEVKTEQCESCLRYFDTSRPEEKPTIFFHDGGYHCCCRACLNIFILTRRSIVQCNWCRVKKYDFDMIKRISSSGQVLMMCSLNCLSLYHVSISAVSSRRVKCDFCKELSQAQYHLTMSDATVRNFCSYECVMTFQSQYSKSPLTLPEEDMTFSSSNSTTGSSQVPAKKVVPLTVQSGPVPAPGVDPPPPPVPVISAVHSLASDRTVQTDVSNSVPGITISSGVNHSNVASSKIAVPNSSTVYRQIIVKPPNVKEMKNKLTSCKPLTHSRSVDCRSLTIETSTQTDEFFLRGPILIPVPVPIYVPAPMAMYSHPYPVPMPFPLPIPVPVIVPSKLSLKEIVEKAEVLSSVTPEEAEILMMAELVADNEKEVPEKTETRSNSPADDHSEKFQADSPSDPDIEKEQNSVPSTTLLPNLDVDLEEDIIISKVTGPAISEDEASTDEQQGSDKGQVRKLRVRGRGRGNKSKRSQPPQTAPGAEDALEDNPNGLKASLGVSAWQVWVQQKNSELSKVTSNSRRLKLFKTELLQMTLEELNYALCLFVKEVRKPGGRMYAPDTILYFCLGIQHYLMENGRIDNIFTDLYFEKFTECLDQVATTFPTLTKETKLIETRVEEEHLWESRQLGAHSPYVLLSTLVFFNTKYFHLWTVEDHAKLSFEDIIKVWKKPRSRHGNAFAEANTSLLRLTCSDKKNDENTPKKIYEQEENTSIPIRCPVKHYEFYLSKCPDPLKKVGDLFYLLPERACVPDSPVWYSSTALGPDALAKILHRIQMVKEVNKTYVEELAESLEENAREDNESTE